MASGSGVESSVTVQLPKATRGPAPPPLLFFKAFD